MCSRGLWLQLYPVWRSRLSTVCRVALTQALVSSFSLSVQFSCSVMSNSLRPHELQHARPPCPSPTPKFTQTHVTSIKLVMPSSHLILCHPLLLPPIPPSIRVFSNESTLCMRWPKYWSFSFSISPSNKHPGLIFRMDWLDLLAVQGILKSLLQHLTLGSTKTIQLSRELGWRWEGREEAPLTWEMLLLFIC